MLLDKSGPGIVPISRNSGKHSRLFPPLLKAQNSGFCSQLLGFFEGFWEEFPQPRHSRLKSRSFGHEGSRKMRKTPMGNRERLQTCPNPPDLGWETSGKQRRVSQNPQGRAWGDSRIIQEQNKPLNPNKTFPIPKINQGSQLFQLLFQDHPRYSQENPGK